VQELAHIHDVEGYRSLRRTAFTGAGQTKRVINANFIYVAVALSALGAAGYVRDTLRGETSPNRVTWSLWGVEGVLAFAVEVQQHVGLASLMTLMLGLVPFAVVLASFKNPNGVWRIGVFDVTCGVIALAGLVSWCFIHEPTVALIAFVGADQVAGWPTVRKSWRAPATESAGVFILGCANCGITILTLHAFTTAGALFPGFVFITDLLMSILILTRVGPRVRHDRSFPRPAPSGTSPLDG
jgi:hypothetical protein